MRKARLTLVGAGPGDPELITVKGLKAIQDADVILYDALANRTLLDYRKDSCQILFVGKRAGLHKYSQEEINQLIVDFAKEHGHVVRLKGGDPFMFGRGYEELEFAAERGIDIEVVPGLSSAMAVPAVNFIPPTSRGVNESVRIVTASTKTHELSCHITTPLPEDQSLIILMGIKWLAQICRHFIKEGQGDYPMAIIRNGSLPDQLVYTGTISSLYRNLEIYKFSSPSIIVIGKVVELRAKLNSLISANEEKLRKACN